MSKILTAYFSASGVTKNVTLKIAKAAVTDIFEIEPKEHYTASDLDWTDKKSRSTIEMNDSSFRPAIAKKLSNPEDYDTILLGFPVWWYAAPTIINTFLENTDLAGKKIALFCTSGGMGIEGCETKLKKTYGNKFEWKKGKRFTGGESEILFSEWVNSLIRKSKINQKNIIPK
ncbi:MAG: NAD(P)H-dependent oxidoreductase [Clostridiales bacterium]|nr:NAD(P)H-dependent oxidoreductase [Clostridiales bacterium]